MEIIEQSSIAKNPKKKSEDGVVVTDDFIAVIDGSTSKSQYRHSLFNSNGRYAMLLVSRYIRKMPKNITCSQFMKGVTAYIRKHYKKSMLPRLAEQPEDRLTASVVVFSRLQREIWMIGDCQCLLIDGEQADADVQFIDNPKLAEAELAKMRAEEVKRQLADGKTVDDLLQNDTARSVIIPHMIETMRQQNIIYSVVDGFPIDARHIKIITLDFRPWELVLASDGYPFLCSTLAESEAALQHQRKCDPLNIGPHFQATKAFHPDNNSFDDRTYIRFRV
jgi:glycerophosphoryl diester phosphodiesterase